MRMRYETELEAAEVAGRLNAYDYQQSPVHARADGNIVTVEATNSALVGLINAIAACFAWLEGLFTRTAIDTRTKAPIEART